MEKKEESPQTNRRRTRSSSVTSPSNIAIEREKPSDRYVPSLDDLVFGEDSISFDGLLSSLPGRHTQILELLHLFGPINSHMFLPLFIYGDASTGKSSSILQIFRHLNRPFIYSSCLTCYSPRILFESILNQLLLHQKNADNGYSSVKHCDKPSDFVGYLREALINVINTLQGNSGNKSTTKKSIGQANGNMIYLIFDNFELVREWEKSPIILPFLFNLHEILKMKEVGFIFISSTSLDTYHSSTGFIEPIPVYFPEYTEDDIRQIFIKNQNNPKLFSGFLDLVLRPFCRITRQLDKLSVGILSLFKIYCEPIRNLDVVPSGEMKRRLLSHVKPHITPSLNEVFWVSSPPSPELEISKESTRKSVKRKIGGREVSDELDFHMSTSAKYLLISAFLASRNPATLDASLFDSTGGSDSRKRVRKNYEKTKELKEAAEQESLMKGPGSFPLERLLAIFQCITSVPDISLDGQYGDDSIGIQSKDTLMSDVLLQLSSLCSANLIVKGASCPLEGSARYRSTVGEDMAVKVARSLKFPLSKYIYRR